MCCAPPAPPWPSEPSGHIPRLLPPPAFDCAVLASLPGLPRQRAVTNACHRRCLPLGIVVLSTPDLVASASHCLQTYPPFGGRGALGLRFPEPSNTAPPEYGRTRSNTHLGVDFPWPEKRSTSGPGSCKFGAAEKGRKRAPKRLRTPSKRAPRVVPATRGARVDFVRPFSNHVGPFFDICSTDPKLTRSHPRQTWSKTVQTWS